MRTKVMVVLIASIVIVGALGFAGPVSAQEQNGDDVNVSVGQSLSVAVDSTSSDIGEEISNIAREQALGSATDNNTRAEVLSEDLNNTIQNAQDVRNNYQNLVEEFNNGEMERSEFVTRIAKLNNRAEVVQSNVDNIRYAGQFINQEDLERANVTDARLDNASDAVGVVGGGTAEAIKKGMMNPGSKIRMNASGNGISASVSQGEEAVYDGSDEDLEEHDTYNITSEEATKSFEDEFNLTVANLSEFEIERDDGYYEIEGENENASYEATVDGRDGSIVNKGFSRDRPDREPAGPPEDVERGPPEDVPRGPPEWADDEDDESDEEESDMDEDDSDEDNVTYNVTREEAEQTALDSVEGNWSVESVDMDEGLYEFDLVQDDSENETEVVIDGETGEVVESEEESEGSESDEEQEGADDSDAESEEDEEEEGDDEESDRGGPPEEVPPR